MKIKHGINDFQIRDRWTEVPHECHDKDCPGNRNRLRLELWDEMLTACKDARMDFINFDRDAEYDWHKSQIKNLDRIITKAKELK